jgi:hypothetical protein
VDLDPCVWTREHAGPAGVRLRIPPKAPREWDIFFSRKPDGRCAVDVFMCTAEEGPSSLGLQLDLEPREDGTFRSTFVALQTL